MSGKIDFVITWVNGDDLKWQEQRNKYLVNHFDMLYNTEDRYRNWDNLEYWFRGIEKFAPFVNKIHFITEGHLPKWLNTNHPKLNIIKHTDYIPEEYLPTFNSNVIELNLHRIKGLEENFVLFNDDLFLTDYVKEEDFFASGKLVENIREEMIIQEDPRQIFPQILINCISIINRNFNKKMYVENYEQLLGNSKFYFKEFENFLGFNIYHLTNSYKKSILEEVWKVEEKALGETSENKFRTVYDMNQYLFKFWQIAKGNVEIRKGKLGESFYISNDSISEIVNNIKTQKYKEICINDSREIENFEELKNKIKNAFQEILPNKSSFEIEY